MQDLPNYLLQTLSPDVNLRKPAEKFIEKCENEQGFGRVLLELINNPQTDATISLCSTVVFKNYIRKHWSHEDDLVADKIPQADRMYIKEAIIDLLLKSNPNIQKQLGETVCIIGKKDFPLNWPSLLDKLVMRIQEGCTQQNFVVINGALHTLSALFKRYQFEEKSDPLWLEIKYVIDVFARPLTDLFVWLMKMIPDHIANQPNIKIILNSVEYCVEIFYSLNSQDIPEFFEDNLKTWMTHFSELLHLSIAHLSSDGSDEPSVLENVKSQICECILLYADKYSEEFESYLGGFIQQVWSLLDQLNNSVKYDILVSNAIRFLSVVAERGFHKEIFEKQEVLKQISTRIIIPNMEFREFDEELFEDNPEEYIHRDIEGADVHTRRRAACDFVKALGKHFELPMTTVFKEYIDQMLANYASNVSSNWKSKDAALYLVTSMVVKGGSVRLGTLSTSDLIDVNAFFNNVIRCELEREDVNQLPVLKADALKYIIIFRNQLSKDIIVYSLPQIIRHMCSPTVIVHSYAANCLHKLLMLRDPANQSQTLVKAEELAPHANILLESLFKIFNFEGSTENEYAIKAIMCSMSLLKEHVLPFFEPVVQKLTTKLAEVAKNPSKPNFNHYLFETLSLSIRIACSKDPNIAKSFESVLFPIFNTIITQDVQEFIPYVLQILALLVEQYTAKEQISQAYLELFHFLLTPDLWEKPANIEPLVRLLQSYIIFCSDYIIAQGKLPPLLGVYQKLVSSKMSDHRGINLIMFLVVYTDAATLSQYMKQVFTILFNRLTQAKTVKFVKHLLPFFSLFAYKYGATAFFEMIESIQPKMFFMVIERLFIADAQKVSGRLERKILTIGLIRMLTDLDVFFNNAETANLWASLLQSVVAVFELPEDTQQNGNDEHFVDIDQSLQSYQASYCQLLYAKAKPVDLIPDIQDIKLYLAKSLETLSARFPGQVKLKLALVEPACANFLQAYCVSAGVNLQ